MSRPPLPPDPLSCLRLWVRTGDEQAFAAVVEAYTGLVLNTARQCLGGDAEGAGEVAQNVFLTAARKAPQLARLDGLSAWFHTTAMKESANHRRGAERRRKRQERHALRETPDFASPEIPVDPGRRPASGLIAGPSGSCYSPEPDTEDPRGCLNDALASLKPAEREILLSRFFENRPFTAIAETLGSSPDAVRMKCRRAMDKLADWFRGRGITAGNLTLGSILATHWSHPAPEHLSGAIRSAVQTRIAASAAASGPVSAPFAVMASSKSLTAAAILLAVLIPLHRQHERIRGLETDLALTAAAPVAKVLPSARKKGSGSPAPGPPGLTPFIGKAEDGPLPEPVTAAGLLKKWTRNSVRQSMDGLMVPPAIRNHMGVLSKLFPGELAAILRELDATPAGEDVKTEVRTLLIQTVLASKAPRTALETGLETRLKDRVLGRIAEQWAGQDPAAAQAWLEARSRQGSLAPARFGEDPESELWSGVARGIARQDPAAAADWVRASLHSTVAPAMLRGLAPVMTDRKWQGLFLELAGQLPAPVAVLNARGHLLASSLKGQYPDGLWAASGELLNSAGIPEEARTAVLIEALRINAVPEDIPGNGYFNFAQAWTLAPDSQRREVLLRLLEFQEPAPARTSGPGMRSQENAVAELARALASTDPDRSTRYLGMIEDPSHQAALRAELAPFLQKP